MQYRNQIGVNDVARTVWQSSLPAPLPRCSAFFRHFFFFFGRIVVLDAEIAERRPPPVLTARRFDIDSFVCGSGLIFFRPEEYTPWLACVEKGHFNGERMVAGDSFQISYLVPAATCPLCPAKTCVRRKNRGSHKNISGRPFVCPPTPPSALVGHISVVRAHTPRLFSTAPLTVLPCCSHRPSRALV